jgi:hypothetical protein
MAISNISANTLVDSSLLNTMITAINNNGDAVTRASSSIYNTGTQKVVESYMGAWSLITNQKTVSDHVISETKGSVNRKQVPISFNKTFASPPLVFVSIESLNTSGDDSLPANSLTSAVVADITNTGCQVYVNIQSQGQKSNSLSYKVSIMAIGINRL